MKEKIALIMCIIIIITVLSLTVVGCDKKSLYADSIITIMSDARVEIILDSQSRVISASPLNRHAEVLLVDVDLVGDTINGATKRITTLLMEMGYINNLRKEIYIDTISTDEKSELKYNRILFDEIKNVDSNIDVKAFNFETEEREYRSFLRNAKGYENFTFLQYRLITNLMRYNSSITIKIGAKISVEDLTKMLVDEYNYSAGYHTYELSQSLARELKSQKLKLGGEISVILGGEFAIHYNCFEDLIEIANIIMDNRVKSKIDDKVINNVLTSLGVADKEISGAIKEISNNQYGYPISASLNQYINQLFLSKVFITNSSKIEYEILIDQAKLLYDSFLMPLTTDEKNSIIAILPQAKLSQYYDKLNGFDDVYLLIRLMIEELGKIYDKSYMLASEEQKSKVNGIIPRINSASEDIKTQNKHVINQEYNKLRLEKNIRLENYS